MTYPVLLLLVLAVGGVGVVHVAAQAGVAGGTGDAGHAVGRVLSADTQVRLPRAVTTGCTDTRTGQDAVNRTIPRLMQLQSSAIPVSYMKI